MINGSGLLKLDRVLRLDGWDVLVLFAEHFIQAFLKCLKIKKIPYIQHFLLVKIVFLKT